MYIVFFQTQARNPASLSKLPEGILGIPVRGVEVAPPPQNVPGQGTCHRQYSQVEGEEPETGCPSRQGGAV